MSGKTAAGGRFVVAEGGGRGYREGMGGGGVTEADGSTSNFLLHNNEKESFA